MLREEMFARWLKLWDERGTPRTAAIDAAFDRLYMLYTDPERGYHNLEHIKFCLDEYDTVRHLSRHKFSLEAAIWWHDVIYNPKRNDNEEQSMYFAQDEMQLFGESPHFIRLVSGIIMATVHRGGVIDPDQQLMCDIDLASLGSPSWDVVCANSRGIRKEYAHVPEADYIEGRSKILAGFAARESLYYTTHFHALYMDRARENIRREIAHLPQLARL